MLEFDQVNFFLTEQLAQFGQSIMIGLDIARVLKDDFAASYAIDDLMVGGIFVQTSRRRSVEEEHLRLIDSD